MLPILKMYNYHNSIDRNIHISKNYLSYVLLLIVMFWSKLTNLLVTLSN